jgi:hypothetical protein
MSHDTGALVARQHGQVARATLGLNWMDTAKAPLADHVSVTVFSPIRHGRGVELLKSFGANQRSMNSATLSRSSESL